MDLHVERSGSGRPLVWGHGLTSSIAAERDSGAFVWEDVDGLDVIRYDARGHGRSPAGSSPADHVWSRLADDFLAVADEALGSPTASFVAGGASMGCATALFAALRAPDRVEALVLAIPPTAWETRAAQAEQYLGSVGYLEAKGLDAFIAAGAALPARPAWTEARRAIRQRHLAASDPAALALALRGAAESNLPPREEVATISVPTLILAWEDDPGHPVSTATALAELIDGAELSVATSEDDVRAWPSLVGRFLLG
jgi:pimeloyl-ACP methyl ester carboxylesterase